MEIKQKIKRKTLTALDIYPTFQFAKVLLYLGNPKFQPFTPKNRPIFTFFGLIKIIM